ncbi:hydantoinase/oxoprolinase family protein [Roseovarius sp. Pro17]|uniref:hydantoinase/oxoprolinase family protein n=1 Tax=Roseovarius sp. Pro17 TaxID=3108175 RepID=UPI002D77833D|nr:hydantoinase/oxoprolinase family protein [Roseovarius sp. Pro17]
MAILLGVDTGGTYTDAVLIRDETEVIASAKALTTRHDLAIGIGEAVANVLAAGGIAPGQIALASLSTTLATNALVEGQGARAGLIYVGFREQDLDGHGLRAALGGDPALILSGGHNHAGYQARPLDRAALEVWLSEDRGISAFAVASQFATRNPEHELEVARMVAQLTGRPVSCSHHLSAKLNGPKRALTALLNARLIGMITRLIDKAEGKLIDLGITAPLMVVRGDGALISSKQAQDRPIETILSGPAASIVGARWLTGVDTALVSDIGGTTTDVAVLRGGKPMIDPAGALVGPWRTMVEAVGMRTTGLGGDSEVVVQDDGLAGGVTLGPRRVLPVALIAHEARDIVHRTLDTQLRSTVPGEYDAVFVRAVPGIDAGGLPHRDAAVLQRIVDGGVQSAGGVLGSRLEEHALRRLVRRGLVQVSGVTPSDASHAMGQADIWDGEAAEKALTLLARKRTGSGNRLADDSAQMARIIVDQLTHQTVLAILESAFADETESFGLPPDHLARHVLTQRGLNGTEGLVQLNTSLNVAVVGLGASAACYYPAVGDRLGCKMILPEHAGVANAIGAIVGRVTIRRSGTVTSLSEDLFRVHLDTGPEDYEEADAALDALQGALEMAARAEALAAGAEDIQITATRDLRTAQTGSRQVFLEGEITVEASGRPRIAT